jgi:hypothetical protein
LREAAYEEMRKIQNETASLTPQGFTEVKLKEDPILSPSIIVRQGQICIDIGRIRIAADSEYPVKKLTDVMREMARL